MTMQHMHVDPLILISDLSGLIEQPPTSIEILPGGLEEWQVPELPSGAVQPNVKFPFVYFEGNLGIPKKVLYRLYMAAVNVPRSSPLYPQASTIILVANPAHQTALNSRKRLIQTGVLSPQKELTFTELLIRGDNEWAKQSIVWHHRRWIFGVLYGEMSSTGGCACTDERNLFPRIPPFTLRAEFQLIRGACESYPRNYHAWAHWHAVVKGVCCVAHSGEFLSETDSQAYIGVVISEGLQLREWLNTHVSDYSAMYQLLNLALTLKDVQVLANGQSQNSELLECNLLALQAAELAERYPLHQSLWLYLRVLCDRMKMEDREGIVERLRQWTSSEHIHLSMLNIK
ncbi:hypothetical protein BDQ17DRAFT_1271664 [Cyathus striatus]|nr:hypothetical protein BDQ17DRAFT_1271664 [Cyathus striatus]